MYDGHIVPINADSAKDTDTVLNPTNKKPRYCGALA